ncbi:MAG TPA: alpha-hydroxy acid oxidase [Candidatus Limnocylindrales bacterium]|nr:alpha-hydroxy acid oxidase [Candidatus Limnocylindrales bacterium]
MTTQSADIASVVSLADLEALARECLEPAAWDYLAGGAEDEITLADNVAAFRRRRLVPRVLVDVAAIDTRTTILGREVAIPIGVAPVAAQALAHPDAEPATARAAAAAGALFCLSTVSSRSIEEVAEAVPGDAPRWFQLYVNEDPAFTQGLVRRAEAAGYGAIVLTVDLPVLGYREREKRRGWELDTPLGNFDRSIVVAADPDQDGEVDLDRLLDSRHVRLTWDDLATIRSWSSLPLVLKGILHPDDARLAVEHGAAGIVVSNHGGRQLDRSPAALDMLEAVVAAVDGRAEVYIDGGVRRGSDALIAIALGATAVFAGRPFVAALGAAGEPGVGRAFEILREELERSMALLGTPTLADVRREHVLGG